MDQLWRRRENEETPSEAVGLKPRPLSPSRDFQHSSGLHLQQDWLKKPTTRKALMKGYGRTGVLWQQIKLAASSDERNLAPTQSQQSMRSIRPIGG
jgi:hypothetical protein